MKQKNYLCQGSLIVSKRVHAHIQSSVDSFQGLERGRGMNSVKLTKADTEA